MISERFYCPLTGDGPREPVVVRCTLAFWMQRGPALLREGVQVDRVELLEDAPVEDGASQVHLLALDGRLVDSSLAGNRERGRDVLSASLLEWARGRS